MLNPSPPPSVSSRSWIDPDGIHALIEQADPDPVRVREVIARARQLQGLEPSEAAVLLACGDPELRAEMDAAAAWIKDTIYGKRLVLFAPLYVSNLCSNECLYCAFRARNRGVERRCLDQEEIAEEVRHLVRMGHKRLLLVAGEQRGRRGLDYLLRSIETVYATRAGPGEIRRLNVNVAPMTVEQFRELAAARIGTYQMFQETFHPETYRRVHLHGPKADYENRLAAIGRAMEAGIDDVGVGVLFGLYDHRFEILALLSFAQHLERVHGVGPHTISVPRLEPADGSAIAADPPHAVSDAEFRTIVAVLRMAVPYTGIIMSTRETPRMRAETLSLGVSQISAGSRTHPGGYAAGVPASAQFELGDHRSLDEVIQDVLRLGFVPSFCTACYRLGRTGEDFMDLAKPGLIRRFCLPNALLTFQEYLEDYASGTTRRMGRSALRRHLEDVPTLRRRHETYRRLSRIRGGARDLYF